MATTGALTPSQIAAAAKAGGFPDSEIPLAVAIALAESSGDPRAHNPKPPDDSYGLWQINMLGPLGPMRRAQWGLESNAELFDPVTNAKAAHSVRRSQGWGAWSVYTNGKYKQHMNVTQGLKIPILPVPIPPNITSAALEPMVWIGRGLFRVGMFVGGGVLLLAGLALMAAQGQNAAVAKIAKPIVGAVGKAGKVAKPK